MSENKYTKASKRLNKISNRLFVVIFLFVAGIMFFPLGIIAWVFAFGVLASALAD